MSGEAHPELAERAHSARLQVAIDGPAGAGKSTVGRRLAELLHLPLLDTGLMYREVSRRVRLERVALDVGNAVVDAASAIAFSLSGRPDESALEIDGNPISLAELHTSEIDQVVSVVAARAEVRSILVRWQRQLAHESGIVMLGRDIGTVVLPSSRAKIFLTASPAVRAQRRRHDRPSDTGRPADESGVRIELESRDRRDETREVSPLQAAADAVTIDTSDLSIDQAVDEALRRSIEPALLSLHG